MQIAPGIAIDEGELQEQFLRSPGPGGQHVNTTATAVQLRFNVFRNRSLPEPLRRRLVRLAGRRMTRDGDLLIEAHRFRSREQNREDARQRLMDLVREASQRPKARIPTRPGAAAKRRRLDAKKQRQRTKAARGKPSLD
ncbi:alternative ribosome rescue aminoacyl-tRNA hydrolase ArfB [Alkalilimnicola sp. S0819]|uniref:alternative ribosome rescue aminoacyl-tRNA hydrolase ArfB n=1 Tax=Alkalilimnicola sp. S0819 TaxID=2613922 RepID=UPI00299F88D5|nr:alternative ribosome rescue aminoacyl-tRNA hydrolase ArfB [Alkalilimnicola sp. S0819]